MSSTTELNESQLAASRSKAWHQDGDAVLTLETARDWINTCGIVLFTPRTAQLPVPAPSLVEATLGAATSAPSLAETQVARSLVARLAGEGLALPLNLLGVPGDSPDFVVSAQVFSYIFTLRGDKAWKQPPSTSGAVKVSPLGLRVYEVLTERGPMSAAELATELGREVTEAAILRSLTELWSQLRVLPLLSQGEGATLWELTSRRFTKAIKAGANAGLPSALSAVVSLYLAQVFGATEEEVATFCSPLTARSRVREVLHALVGARQLETVVVEGKTLLHIPGGLPAAGAAVAASDSAAAQDLETTVEPPKKVGTGRILKFTDKNARKPAGEFRGKPAERGSAGRGARPQRGAAARPAAGARAASFGGRSAPKFAPRADGKTNQQRRPFQKSGKPSFSKPWEEEKSARPQPRPAADGFTKYRRPEPEDRAPLGPREQAGLPADKRSAPKSTRSFDRAPGERSTRPGGYAKRPYAPKSGSDDRPNFKPRSFERRDGSRQAASSTGGEKRPFTPRRAEGGGQPFPRKSFKAAASDGEAKPFPRKPYSPREANSSGTAPGGKRPYTPRGSGDAPRSFAKRPFTPRPFAPRATESSSESSVERTLPKRPYKPRASDADQRKYTKAPWSPPAEEQGAAPRRSFKPRGDAGAARGAPGARKFSGKPPGKFGSKRGNSFGPRRNGPAGPKKPRTEE